MPRDLAKVAEKDIASGAWGVQVRYPQATSFEFRAVTVSQQERNADSGLEAIAKPPRAFPVYIYIYISSYIMILAHCVMIWYAARACRTLAQLRAKLTPMQSSLSEMTLGTS